MNTRKTLKMLIIPMIILAIILVISPISNAGMGSNARAESGPMPYTTPGDAPGGPAPTPGASNPYADIVITVPHYVYVEGKVYEDLNLNSEIMDPSDLEYYNKGIPNVRVSLVSNLTYLEDGTIDEVNTHVVSTAITDEDGHFKLTANEGTYDLICEYGDIEVASTNQADILYYNGYDYAISELPSGSFDDSIDIRYQEIINAGKAASQVFLLMDSSESMRHTEVVVNGETKTRLQNAIDSAKVLVDELLEDNDNIYIGIVNFAGNNWRAASLSNNADFLKNVLDEIATYPDYYYAANTNIVGAIDKAMESFYVDKTDSEYWKNCNRTIILISDGIATSDGVTQTYCDESDEVAVSKMINTIGPNTREKVKKVLDEEVYFMNLLVKPTDTDEINYINSIYRDIVTLFKEVENEEELSEAIRNDIQVFIESHIEVGELETIEELRARFPGLSDSELSQLLYTRQRGRFMVNGLENSLRRKEIDGYFDKTAFYYNVIKNRSLAARSIIFNQIHAITDQSEADLLSSRTKMNGKAGPYNIDPPSNNAVYTEVRDIPEEYGGGTYTITYVHYDTGYENQNVGLYRRPDFKLKVSCTATGLRVMLNDNTIISTNTREINSTKPLIEYLDDDLSHGATIQVEFTVDVENDSKIPCNYIELIDCMPKDFLYNKDYKLISETGTNAKYNWQTISIENLKDGYLSENSVKEIKTYYYYDPNTTSRGSASYITYYNRINGFCRETGSRKFMGRSTFGNLYKVTHEREWCSK